MHEFSLADGNELDIPEGSILLLEEMTETTNPNFPTARCFIQYRLGNEVRSAVLSSKFEDVLFETKATTDPRWLRLTLEDERRLGLLSHQIVARVGNDEGCTITAATGSELLAYKVKESRRQIKKWSEPKGDE